MPPSDSRLKLTISPCFKPTSSTQSLGRETIRVEYPTFWTFRASIMRDMMCILYTNRKKNGEYILALRRMVCLYRLQWLLTFQRLRVRFGMRLFGFLPSAPPVRKTQSKEKQ